MAGSTLTGRLKSAALVGIVCALAGSAFLALPWGWEREQSVGLHWLFHARGPQRPPAKVVVVALDKASAEHLGVPYEPRQWPRSLHARLISALHRAGVRTIVFDLLFREATDDDGSLVAAIQSAGNVVLLEFLEKCQVEVVLSETAPQGPRPDQVAACRAGTIDFEREQLHAELHRLVPPVAALATVAAATGPFTLPDVPSRAGQFWTFDGNAGDAPSLSLLALLVSAELHHARGWAATRATLPELPSRPPGSASQVVDLLRDALQRRPQGSEGTAVLRQDLQASPDVGKYDGDIPVESLLAALAAPTSRYLNFYGPPWTVRTIPYHSALSTLEDDSQDRIDGGDWNGGVVFIGVSSPVQWEERDAFRTPFTDPITGHDLSGVEILATAFANLRDQTTLRPVRPVHALVLAAAWGLALGFSARLVPPLWSAVVLLLLGAAYFYLAHRLFGATHLWLPLVGPLVVQGPLALLMATTLHYQEQKRERARVRELFRYYLPEPVVHRLAREGLNPLRDRERLFGVCLYSDAARYTTLAEDMDPEALAALLNEYYKLLFEPVRRHYGIVSDIVGDAMMAIWAAREDEPSVRAAACRAALEILEQTGGWDPGGPALPTRIGLHCGTLAMAHVGAGDHFEYRAVGDIVNAASRLQELNKTFGTRVLASADVVRGIDDLVSQRLGTFLLTGKSRPLDVNVVLGWGEARRQETDAWRQGVDEALTAFAAREWDVATSLFANLDGVPVPSLAPFYLAKIASLRHETLPPGWLGTVSMSAVGRSGPPCR